MLTASCGYAIGNIPNLLVYNIKIDPLLGMGFAVIFSIPFAYSAIKFGLFSIRVIAKQVFIYSLAVAIVGGMIN